LAAVVLIALAAHGAGPDRECILFDRSYGERLTASNKDAGLWWTSSGWKVSRTRSVPRHSGKAVEIRLARNETEAAQLVVRPSKPL
jgi:hypothetical protein